MTILAVLLGGCTSAPVPESQPTCGAAIPVEQVLFIDAREAFAAGGLEAAFAYARSEAGPIGWLTDVPFTTDLGWRRRDISGDFVSQVAADSGCDVAMQIEFFTIGGGNAGSLSSNERRTRYYLGTSGD